MEKHIDLNPLNKMAGGNCKSMGEMFKKIGDKHGVKKLSDKGVPYTELSKEKSIEILNILNPE